MKSSLSLSGLGLILAAGCAISPADTPDGATALAQVESNLARLDALQVVEVGELVEAIPEGAANCYGLPCNDEDAARIATSQQEQAIRLAELVQVAEAAVGGPAMESASSEVDDNLTGLRDLGIVEVGALMVVEPERNCAYSQPCEEDLAAAEAANLERASDLARIVDAARDL